MIEFHRRGSTLYRRFLEVPSKPNFVPVWKIVHTVSSIAETLLRVSCPPHGLLIDWKYFTGMFKTLPLCCVMLWIEDIVAAPHFWPIIELSNMPGFMDPHKVVVRRSALVPGLLVLGPLSKVALRLDKGVIFWVDREKAWLKISQIELWIWNEVGL